MAGFFDSLGDLFTNPQLLGMIGSAMETGSKFSTGQQQIQYAQRLREASEFVAAQLDEQANNAIASAQRLAWSEARAAKYLASETLARAAASGGGASDPTVINIMAAQAAEGAYRQQVALYEGDARARQLRLQAQAKRYEGASQEASAKGAGRSSMLSAGTSLLKGMAQDSSMYQRFGGGGPQVAQQGGEAVLPSGPHIYDEAEY